MFERDRSFPRAMTVDGSAAPEDAQREATTWITEHHQELGGRILLLVPRKTDFASERNRLTQFAKLSTVTVDTARGSINWRGGPVLAAWPTRETLAKIDDDPRTRALCVIPWGDETVREWAQAYTPKLLGAATAVEAVALDPVVEQGLLQLTRMVNHSNNLAGSLDHRDAVSVLRELHRGGYELPHRDIYSWALAHGWPARGAERLRDMAERIDAGRVVQMKGTSPLRADILDLWRADARERPRRPAPPSS